MSEFMNDEIRIFGFIENIVSSNKLSHAYLIELSDYEGDFKKVKDFVKLILCEKNNKNYSKLNCKNCNICSLVDTENYPDLQIIEPDGKEIKKTQILSIQSEFNNKSLLNNKRIYIIKEADKLNVSAANTILKFLEEPEDDIIAILVTKNRYNVIETILSRCQVLTFNTPSKIIDINDDVIELFYYMYGNDNIFIKYNDIYNNIIPNKEQAKELFNIILNVLLQFLEHLLIGNKVDLPDDIIVLLKKIDKNRLIKEIMIIESHLEILKFNLNYKLWLDSLFAQMLVGDLIG